ncbi:potassium channel family protein [Bacillus testis]|uniref:potassium channel family protein n=1 Tax=Bacillus testis TaxID=1622072 RepID=UPI00067F12A6|nr:potassium channel family protein [Bacillus testis]
MNHHFRAFFSKIPRLGRLIIIVFLLVSFFGIAITLIEPFTFPTLLDGIWWAIITTSTVGYGDFVPKTPSGKIIGMMLILTGAGFVTSYFAVLAKSAVQSEESFLRGTQAFNGEGHYIIVGWNERSKNIIASLRKKKDKTPIVLIDQSLKKHPDTQFRFHFLHGKATEDEVLKHACIQNAKKILITADFRQREFQTDMFSILTLIACKGLNPSIYACIEILTAEQVENAKRAGADEIIQTNVFAGERMVQLLTGEEPTCQ